MPPIISEEYREKRKSLIVKSALECFAQKGFATTTVHDIGTRCGLSKGSIYTYFDSKEAIYLELLQQATEKDKEDINKNFHKLRSSYSKINFLFDVYLHLDPFDPQKLGTTVVFYEFTFHCTRSETFLEPITERGNFLVNLIRETLEQGQESGEFSKDIDVDVYAHKFWLIIDGVSLQTIYKDFPYYDVFREMKEMYLEEIKNK
ncbi:TetR/AcrR family transcriptional regulator [Pseudoneobacillus sp. C159]